jgi:hypothetical protein
MFMMEPNLAIPSTLTELPILEADLSDNVDPQIKKSNTEQALDSVAIDLKLNVEPNET